MKKFCSQMMNVGFVVSLFSFGPLLNGAAAQGIQSESLNQACASQVEHVQKVQDAIVSLGNDRASDYWRPMLAGELGLAVNQYAECLAKNSPQPAPDRCAVDEKHETDAEASYESNAPDDPAYYNDLDQKLDEDRIAAFNAYWSCLEKSAR